MGASLGAKLPLLMGTGFLLGWSVAWPPGPINAEIARRCLARGFWAGFGLLLGACSGDALWALLVSLGVGAVLTTPALHAALGVVSIALLLTLAALFLRGAWADLRTAPAAVAPSPARFDGTKASYLLGVTMALTSPWNVAFWLAAVGRPEMTRYGLPALLVVAGSVIAGALTWGVLWSGAVLMLRRRATGRAWNVAVKALTGALMLYFAARSALLLAGGG
ncbi:MAG TPA: LysE family transporter [Acetobacteraceae bacterium]|nr:LysE family transporter [Acetobacteraceae bacterium]